MAPALPSRVRDGKATMVAQLGRTLILVGCALAVVGVVLVFAGRIPWLGRLPGDVVVQRERFTLYVPIVTSLVVSIVLTILLNLFLRR